MNDFFESLTPLDLFLTVSGITLIRYLVFAGVAYGIVWTAFRHRFIHRHIQTGFPPRAHILREIGYSLMTVVIFGLIAMAVHHAIRIGFTKVYTDFDEYGAAYAVFSLIVLIVLHDTYFYWAHRLMHHPALYKYLHAVHHRSTNPSPWAALFFQPAEAILEAVILPAAIFIIPLHPLTIFAFLFFMMLVNVIGHLGFELYPTGFTRSPWTWWNNTSTHHNMHHRYVNYNFGLYFNWWDRMMGTNHPKYHETFDAITTRPRFS